MIVFLFYIPMVTMLQLVPAWAQAPELLRALVLMGLPAAAAKFIRSIKHRRGHNRAAKRLLKE